MQVVTFTEARSRLKDVLDDVNDNVETTIISRRNGGMRWLCLCSTTTQ